MPGDSGSPILLLKGEDANVIGIHTAVQQSFEPGVGYRPKSAQACRQVLLQRLLHPLSEPVLPARIRAAEGQAEAMTHASSALGVGVRD